jgi:hypothetical protein
MKQEIESQTPQPINSIPPDNKSKIEIYQKNMNKKYIIPFIAILVILTLKC